MKTRPCKPGDVLAESTVPCGARYTVSVGEPTQHPAGGTTTDHDICLVLRVWLPTGRSGYVRPDLLDDAEILGEPVRSEWGELKGQQRLSRRREFGRAIAPLLAALACQGSECLATAQAICDRHAASVAAQKSARDAAYAAFPVAAENAT